MFLKQLAKWQWWAYNLLLTMGIFWLPELVFKTEIVRNQFKNLGYLFITLFALQIIIRIVFYILPKPIKWDE